jgi:hypothetical protein
MFTFFHRNKYSYTKGQVTPYFIIILVVLIMLAMVTVNLGKVGLIKTDSANSADAGALASGSVMANLFNQIAQTNSQLYTDYWTFFALVSASAIIATVSLGLAIMDATAVTSLAPGVISTACTATCVAAVSAASALGLAHWAVTFMGMAIKSINSISLSVLAFIVAQGYFYAQIRRMAEKGRETAIKIGHQFVFINSGIGSKLKDDQREDFSAFIKGLTGETDTLTYPWTDGQGRSHSVESKVDINPVDTFNLKVAIMPTFVELPLLALAVTNAYLANSDLDFGAFTWGLGTGTLAGSCASFLCCNPVTGIACCTAWQASCVAATAELTTGSGAIGSSVTFMLIALVSIVAAVAGLLPVRLASDSDGSAVYSDIIAWIDDVDHDRKVRVDTKQRHGPADLGIWNMQYPDPVHSYSHVDFRGLGKITPPITPDDLRHDASIYETDGSGS